MCVMRSGICPKCGSADVRYAREGIGQTGAGNLMLRISALSAPIAPTDDYVCVECGYFEQYFIPGRALDKVAERWQRVVPAGPTDRV